MGKLASAGKLTKRFFEDCAEFSFSVAYARLYRDCPYICWEKRREKYENSIYMYLKKHYGKIINEFRENVTKCFEKTEIIWIMWWQGEETMPPIVKACYKKLGGGIKQNIVLITKKNVHEYISIPTYIQEKVLEGKITLTHFSDIVRVMLLEQYGGLWIDATVYVNSLPDTFFEQDFFTLRKEGMFKQLIFRGEWSTFLLYAGNQRNCFQCLRILFCEYWKEHNQVIDYLMFDYFIKIMYDELSDFNELIKNVPETDKFYDLNLKINEVYNPEVFKALCESSYFHKLTYKKEFKNKDEQGRETYYYHLINSKI